MGATYAVLMVVLGDAVWEGYPGAASRVLLPMLLAFNVLLPRGRKWWALLLLGNLTVFFSSETLRAPGRESYRAEGPRALMMVEPSGRTIEAIFPEEQWFQAERSRLDYWRWSRGPAEVILRNPQPFAVVADVTFDLKSSDDRKVTVRAGASGPQGEPGDVLWSGPTVKVLRKAVVRGVVLPPGDTRWKFETDRAPQPPSSGDPRRVAFSVRNLEIRVLKRSGE